MTIATTLVKMNCKSIEKVSRRKPSRGRSQSVLKVILCANVIIFLSLMSVGASSQEPKGNDNNIPKLASQYKNESISVGPEEVQQTSTSSTLNTTSTTLTSTSTLNPQEANKRNNTLKNRSNAKIPNKRQQNIDGNNEKDPIDQVATSQSLSIAEPLMAASNHREQQQQQQQQQKGVSNRWTHFGARLKPLLAGNAGDHNVAAASLKSRVASYEQQMHSAQQPQQQQHHQMKPKAQTLSTNQVDEQDDVDDEQDSEALLYKMMQQQSFLMSPMWQDSANSANKVNLLSQSENVEHPHRAANTNFNTPAGSNSRKVIKLLKSYSHIHQVDDSDDQIRGTYTRLPARRPSVSDNWQQPQQQQQHNRKRLMNNNRIQQQSARQQPQHIFVSSQPMTRAYTNQVRSDPSYANAGADEQNGDNYSSNDSSNQDSSDQGGDPSNQATGDEDDFECPNNGIFADEPSGCQAYHVCQSGAQVQQKFQCPLGTLFNNIILTCDFAHNVQCGGKAKQQSSTTPRPMAAQELHESIDEPPRSLIRANHKAQQARWSPPQQAQQQQQPKHLIIGSQYNKHQQQHQSSQARAINSYPTPTSSSRGVSNSDDDDDEPAEPLVPATLPPRPLQAMPLPYNPPPPPQQPSMNQLKPQQMVQSAHRSQYQQQQHQQQHQQQQLLQPTTTGNYQQGDYSSAPGGYDGASAVTPVFASKDEPTAAPVNRYATGAEQRQQPAEGTQSFNLVINHVSGSPTQQKPATTAAAAATTAPLNLNKRPKANQKQAINQYNNSNKQQSSSDKEESYAKNSNQMKRPTDFAQARINQKVQKQQSSSGGYNSPSATQPKPVHLSANKQPEAGKRGTLIDLTNDRKSLGVSSEAMNDGLLLIVRHNSNSNPIKVGAGTNQEHHKKSKPSGSSDRGQAFAVDPSLIKPNSPIDAQLFPNVQRVLAASQGGPSVNNNNQLSPYSQHVSNAKQAPARVALPLPPMEPPKPVHVTTASTNNNSESSYNELQPVASSASSITKPVGTSQKRVKRTKRLKSTQLPQRSTSNQKVKLVESATNAVVHHN